MSLLQRLKDEFSDFGKKVPRNTALPSTPTIQQIQAQKQSESQAPEPSYPNAPPKFRTVGKESFETGRTRESALFVKEYSGNASTDEMLATARRNDKKATPI